MNRDFNIVVGQWPDVSLEEGPSEKPILFNTNMVKAILDGRKTVTRRPIKPHIEGAHTILGYDEEDNTFCIMFGGTIELGDGSGMHWDGHKDVKPPCKWGDILYVRETWAYGYIEQSDAEGSNEMWFEPLKPGEKMLGLQRYFYKADFLNLDPEYTSEQLSNYLGMKWKPSIHMPKEAARIFLRVTDIRPVWLQKITDDEAALEGFGKLPCEEWVEGRTEKAAFAEAWDKTINHKDRDVYGWDANPLAWRIEFERCEKPEEV